MPDQRNAQHRRRRGAFVGEDLFAEKLCELDAKRSKLRRELFAVKDEVEAQRNDLISQLEVQLRQQTGKLTLFSIELESV